MSSDPPSLDNLSFQFEKVNLGQVTSKLQDSIKDLHPSFSEYDESALTTKAKQPRHLTLSPNSKKSVGKGESSESRKPVSVPFSLSEETVTQSGHDLENGSFVPLSQRVKLRMQNKHGSNKENEEKKEKIVKNLVNEERFSIMKSPGADLSSMSSLLEDIQNLSLKEADKFRHKTKGKTDLGSVSKLHYDSSPHITSAKQMTPRSVPSRKINTMKDFQKMSSPSTDEICTPMTYMKHKGALGDSFEIQKSPYYIENPFSTDKSKSDKKVIDISSPGFFSRPEPKKEPEDVDTRCSAEKLIEKIEMGISKVGTVNKVNVSQQPSSQKKSFPKSVSGDDKFTVESLMSILSNSSSGKGLATPTQKLDKSKSSTPANQSGFGLETSLGQFGDFQIQHSLLDSLCSGLVQALTPKGVSMTKDEYNKLINTLNDMGSEDEDNDSDYNGISESNAAHEEVKCNIDFSELEKASSGFKNLNQKLLLKPIQIDDEDVMAKLSKSARKKLRRRERKQEQELQNLAQMKNVSKCKGRTKGQVPGQNSRRNSIKSSSSDDNISNKNKDKRKYGIENGVHNTLQTKHEGKVKLDTNYFNKTYVKNINNGAGVNLSRNKNAEVSKTTETPLAVTEENDQKLKKKKKKKKVKKASPVIDISGDDSLLDDKKVSCCAEYLKKALENNQRKSSENKILKASPFMDVSADDTLLELEGLSCKVVGDELDSDLENKLKKKKRLSKEKLCSKYGISQTGSMPNEPVLSISDVLKTEASQEKSENCSACKCGVTGERENDEIESMIDNNCEIIQVNLENKGEAEKSVETHDLCNMESPEITNFNGTLNDQKSEELISNVIETAVEDELGNENQEKGSETDADISDLKHFGDAKEVLDIESVEELAKISRNTEKSKFAICGIDNYREKDEILNNEKNYIERNSKCEESKIDNSAEIDEGIKCNTIVKVNGHAKDLGTLNASHMDTSVGHNIYVENLDTEESVDNGNAEDDGSRETDEFLKDKEVANELKALNTYHNKVHDVVAEVIDKTTSVNDKVEKFIDAGNDFMVLNCDRKVNGIIDDNDTDIDGKCFVSNSEHKVRLSTDVCKMESEGNEAVEKERSESETAGLCFESSFEDFHKDKNERNGVSTSDIDLNVSDHENRIDAVTNGMEDENDTNGREEENDKPIIHVKSEVNGIDMAFRSESSGDDKVEIGNMNGKVKEEKMSESQAENFSEMTFNDNNFGKNNINAPEVFHSPACLADRLKLRLRKTSTKNVLDMFTNGK